MMEDNTLKTVTEIMKHSSGGRPNNKEILPEPRRTDGEANGSGHTVPKTSTAEGTLD